MPSTTDAELKMARLLIECLNLEDLAPEDIDPEEHLFGDGLGLDSIDALEIAVAILQEYGVKLKADDEESRSAFATLRSLTEFVTRNS
jgi:acyl carrier protein